MIIFLFGATFAAGVMFGVGLMGLVIHEVEAARLRKAKPVLSVD